MSICISVDVSWQAEHNETWRAALSTVTSKELMGKNVRAYNLPWPWMEVIAHARISTILSGWHDVWQSWDIRMITYQNVPAPTENHTENFRCQHGSENGLISLWPDARLGQIPECVEFNTVHTSKRPCPCPCDSPLHSEKIEVAFSLTPRNGEG